MSKSINLIGLLAVIFVLFSVPLIKVEATWTYVGLQIDTAKRISTDTDFCLLPSTTMSVMQGTTALDTVTVTVTGGICAGTGADHQIWSHLVDLTSGSPYTLKIITPLCFGYWHQNAGVNKPWTCWYAGTQNGGTGKNESCNQICADHGTTITIAPQNGSGRYDEGCGAMRALFYGLAEYVCDYCYDSALSYGYAGATDHPTYPYLYCYNNYTEDNGGAPDWQPGDYTALICTCNYNTGTYNFPFTFTAP